jgi:hypothetical protein
MTTTLAAVKLIPIPPAFVDRRNTGIDASSVNSSTSVCLTSTAVEPVRIRYLMSFSFKIACRMSSICVNYTGVVRLETLFKDRDEPERILESFVPPSYSLQATATEQISFQR